MKRLPQPRLLGILPQTVVVLGLVLIFLALFDAVVRRAPAAATSVDAPILRDSGADRKIDKFRERLRVLPTDHLAYVQLGGAYLQKVRETGDTSYYGLAESSFQEALELDPRNAEAMTLMGALSLGRHRFSEALTWAERSLRISPASPLAYGVLGDAQVELGLYEAAIESFQMMVDLKPNLDSYSRVSYMRELSGDVQGAIEAMEMALDAGAPGTETTAWVRVQLGDLYLRSGRPQKAAELFEGALRDFDEYYLALLGLGRAHAAEGCYEEAINLYERVVAAVPLPGALSELGDLYLRSGDVAKAPLQYDTIELIAELAAINGVSYNRELAMFYADHDFKLDRALQLAREELKVRRDIYGYDALAWALYKNGRPQEAADAMAEAMRLGTRDAALFFHSGMIFRDLGDNELAREYLQMALNLNPNFSILQADVARRALERIVEDGMSDTALVEATR